MVSIKSILSAALAGSTTASAASVESRQGLAGCGEVSVFYTGLPAYHRYVIEQGYDPNKVDREIRQSQIDMMNAGYNVKIVLAGPEQPIGRFAGQMECDTRWGITGIGMGMRGSSLEPIIERFEDNLMVFREKAGGVPTVFNYNPTSFLWSVQRRAPLSSDCADSPGQDLGYVELCEEECSAKNNATIVSRRALNKRSRAMFA